MNNALHMERLMALAWQAAARADTAELTASLARFRASVAARLHAVPDMAGNVEAIRDLPAMTDEFVKAITDAHWCVLLRAGVEIQAEGAYQDDAASIRAFNAVMRSIGNAHTTALEQAWHAISRMGEHLKLKTWELATIRYLVYTTPFSSGENEPSGMAKGDSVSKGAQPSQNAAVSLVTDIAELLLPKQD
jgi:hypothetical protein